MRVSYPPTPPPQPTAAALLVGRGFLALSAAAAGELRCSASYGEIAMFRIDFLAVAFAVLSSAGCSYNPVAPSEQTASQGKATERKTVSMDASIQITPAAKLEIGKVAGRPSGTYVRLEFIPEGCTGMKTHLDVELDPLRPQDSLQDCGGLYCVFLTEQFPLVQGALIDWKEKEKGFTVTFPNKTRENQVKTTKWINDESEKRLRRMDEQDRTSGRIAERIAEMRRLSINNPKNELAHFRLGQLLMLDGQHSEAVKSFEQTLTISPGFSKAAQLLGECLIKTGEKVRAVEVLTKGWITADERGDEPARDAMASLLVSIGAPIPQTKSNDDMK
jgi:Fe-S cluster assembly iron-binding protein IscA